MKSNTPRKSPSRPTLATSKTKLPEWASPPRHAAAGKGQRILRMPAVVERIGWSRATVYRRLGHLRIKLGPNSSGWLESDIDAFLTERIAESRAGAATD